MAKDLPYFKFFCSEWNDGDITLESYEAQGLFINICSYYWSNECDVDFDKLLKKFRGYDEIINDLNAEGLLKINEDRTVCISFLDEQKEEREQTRKVKSKGGKASAEARKLKKLQQNLNKDLTESEHVLNLCSTETQLLREEKIREEEIREDNISFYKESDFLENWTMCRKQFMNLPTHIKKLEAFEKTDFNIALKDFTKEEINTAMLGLFKQKRKNITSMYLKPKHFLENISKYLNAELSKDYGLYGKEDKPTKGGL